MKKSTVFSATVAAVVIGVCAFAAHRQAEAQAAPPPPPPMAGAPRDGMDGPMHEMMHEMMHGGAHGGEHGPMMGRDSWQHRPWGGPPAMGLIYDAKDKNLSAADVQVIAQSMLLRRGNHDWKVANVAVNDDKSIGFAFTTADGGVIAKFSVDPHSGRMRRVG